MRLAVVTYGTKGDTRPMVALCRGLMDAGHDVELLADRSILPLAYAHGVPTHTLAGRIEGKLAQGGALAAVMREGVSDAYSMVRAISQIVADYTESWLLDVIGVAEGADAILCSGYTGMVGLSAAEYLKIPAIGLGLWPITPTREFPAVLMPWSVPSPLNRLSHRAMNALLWRRFRPHLNQARQAVCAQAPRERMWKGFPIAYGISRHLLPMPADWPVTSQICGAWSLPDEYWEPSEALADFLNDGEPPIYVGFGSMAGTDARRSLQIVIEAIGRRRALIYPGASQLAAVELPDNFFVLPETPHDWLFPRTALVIHHGGAGTTHAACRAGVPSVVVPFANDQFFWAGRLTALGMAAPAVPGPRLDAAMLTHMIEHARRPDVRRRAADLATLMAQEDGIEQAVHWIRQWVEHPVSSQALSDSVLLESRLLGD